jgi:hypothetical protein
MRLFRQLIDSLDTEVQQAIAHQTMVRSQQHGWRAVFAKQFALMAPAAAMDSRALGRWVPGEWPRTRSMKVTPVAAVAAVFPGRAMGLITPGAHPVTYDSGWL